MPLPTKTRALIIREAEKSGRRALYDAVVVEKDIPSLKQGELLVKIGAAGFNHREVSMGRSLITTSNSCIEWYTIALDSDGSLSRDRGRSNAWRRRRRSVLS